MRDTIENIFQYSKNLVAGENKLNGLLFFNREFFDDFFNRPAIYFLLDDKDKIIYIGQTVSLLLRLESHLKGFRGTEKKKFKGASWLFVKEEELDFAEAIFINLFQPELNKHIPILKQVHRAIMQSHGINFARFKDMYGKDFSHFVKFWLLTAKDESENIDILKYMEYIKAT